MVYAAIKFQASIDTQLQCVILQSIFATGYRQLPQPECHTRINSRSCIQPAGLIPVQFSNNRIVPKNNDTVRCTLANFVSVVIK